MKIQLSTFLATSSALAVAAKPGGGSRGLGKVGALGIARKGTGGRIGRKSTGGKPPRIANEMEVESPQNAIQIKVLPPSGGKRIYEELDEVDDSVQQALAKMAKYD